MTRQKKTKNQYEEKSMIKRKRCVIDAIKQDPRMVKELEINEAFQALYSHIVTQSQPIEVVYQLRLMNYVNLETSIRLCGHFSGKTNYFNYDIFKNATILKQRSCYSLRPYQLQSLSNIERLYLEMPPLQSTNSLKNCFSIKLHMQDLSNLSVNHVHDLKITVSKLKISSKRKVAHNSNLNNVFDLTIKVMNEDVITDSILALFINVYSLRLKTNIKLITSFRSLKNLQKLSIEAPISSSIELSPFQDLYSLSLNLSSIHLMEVYAEALGNVHDLEIICKYQQRTKYFLQNYYLKYYKNVYSLDLFATNICINASSIPCLSNVTILRMNALYLDRDVDFTSFREVLIAKCTQVESIRATISGNVQSLEILNRPSSSDINELNTRFISMTINSETNLNNLEPVYHCELNIDSYGLDLSPLRNVHTLQLKSYLCDHMEDISLYHLDYFSNIHTLILRCGDMENLSILRNLYHLDLKNCENLIDVSSLGNIHTLILSECVNIVDVSKLGNVHTLDLSGCRSIEDVSALGNVHTLNLSKCWNVWNVEDLGNIYDLSLTCKEESDAWCSHLFRFKGIEALSYVPILHLCRCIRLDDYADCMGKVSKVLSFYPNFSSSESEEDSDEEYMY